jgi:hypothetical protein
MSNVMLAGIAALGLLLVIAAGFGYWQYHKNGQLEAANGQLTADLNSAIAANKADQNAIEKLQDEAKLVSNLNIAVQESQGQIQAATDTASQKVNNAPPIKCPSLAPVLNTFANGLRNIRAASGNKGSSGQAVSAAGANASPAGTAVAP